MTPLWTGGEWKVAPDPPGVSGTRVTEREIDRVSSPGGEGGDGSGGSALVEKTPSGHGTFSQNAKGGPRKGAARKKKLKSRL